MKKVFSFSLLIYGCVFFSILSCSKRNNITNNCSTQVNPIVINFNVLNKATNQDIFFSSNPQFQTKDLFFFKKKDVARKDTIRPIIAIANTARYFQYTSDYTSLQDTLILKIGNLSDNTLIYTIQKTNDLCPNYKLGTVNVNGSVLTATSEKYVFLK